MFRLFLTAPDESLRSRVRRRFGEMAAVAYEGPYEKEGMWWSTFLVDLEGDQATLLALYESMLDEAGDGWAFVDDDGIRRSAFWDARAATAPTSLGPSVGAISMDLTWGAV